MEYTETVETQEVAVIINGLSVMTPVRFLYSSRIGIIQSGPLVGQLVMPFWSRSKTRYNPSGRKSRPKEFELPFYPFRDIYWLYRALLHSRDSYGRSRHGEYARLHEALDASRRLHAELLSLKKGVELDARESQLHQLLCAVMHYLHPRVHLLMKREAVDKITAVSNFRDSQGRQNISALASRMVGVENRLMLREDAIVQIDSIYALRKAVLGHVIEALDFQVNSCDDFFQLLLSEWPAVCVMEYRAQSTINHLTFLASLFESIDEEPYRTTFAYAQKECFGIVHALQGAKFDEGRTLVHRSATGFQLRKLRSDLELGMFKLSRKTHFSESEFDHIAAAHSMKDAIKRLNALDTSQLTNFPKEVAEVYLTQTDGYLEKREIRLAYESLQQALVLL